MSSKPVFEFVSIVNPDDEMGMPIYEGELFGIEKHLVNGVYRGLDEDGNAYKIEITDCAIHSERI